MISMSYDAMLYYILLYYIAAGAGPRLPAPRPANSKTIMLLLLSLLLLT